MKNNKYDYKFIFTLLFLFLSILTIASHSFNLNMESWIDIPTHFAGGMAVAAFLPKETFKKKPLLSLSVIATIGLGWEFIETAIANKEIFETLFKETKADKAGDLIVGLSGFAFIYSKTDAKKK